MKFNHHVDRVKIGLDDDGDTFVRVDLSLRLLDAQEFKLNVEQVAAGADELAGKSRRHLVLALSTRSFRWLAAVCKSGVAPTFPGGFKATSWELGSSALAKKTCRPRGGIVFSF